MPIEYTHNDGRRFRLQWAENQQSGDPCGGCDFDPKTCLREVKSDACVGGESTEILVWKEIK